MHPCKPYFISYLLYFFSCLHAVCAQQPELVLPIGHTSKVNLAQFSPDNKYVLTGGEDKIVNVWETFSGKKIRSLGGNNADISYAFFSNDGKYIAVGTDSAVIIWSVPSYKVAGEFSLIRRTLFSPDSKRMFLLGYDGTLKQVNLPSMKQEFEYQDSINYRYGYLTVMHRVGISSDSRLLATAGNSYLTIREIQGGRVIARKRLNGDPVTCFFTSDGLNVISVTSNGIQKIALKNNFAVSSVARITVESAFLSNNNRFLLTNNSLRSEEIILWDFEKYKPVFRSDTVRSARDTIAVTGKDDVVSFKTGTAAFPFPMRLVFFTAVTVANNGKYTRAMTCLWNNADNTKSYEIANNFLHKSDISRDSRYLLVRQKEDESVCLWDIEAKKIIQSYITRTDKITIAGISADGKKMLTCGEGNSVQICDIRSGHTLHRLKHEEKVASAEFTRDGRAVLTNCYDSIARLWDTESGMLLKSFPKQYPETNPVLIDAGGNFILPVILYDTVPVYDPVDPEKVTEYRVLARTFDKWHLERRLTKSSNTGRYKLAWDEYWSLKLIDSLGKNSAAFSLDEPLSAFSKDDKLLVFADPEIDDTIKLWNIETGAWTYRASLQTSPGGRYGNKGITQLLFTPDNNFLLAVDLNAVIHVLSVPDFKERFSFPGQSCSISGDNKYLLCVNQGKCDIYDFIKRQFLYSYITVDSLNHLVIDAQKRYDGPESVRKMLYFTCGNEIVDLDQVKDQLWVPGLAERIMKGDTINAKTLDQLGICGLTPEIENGSTKTNEFFFKIRPRRGGLGETALLVNGIEAKRYKPGELKKNGDDYELRVRKEELNYYFISGEQNPVTVKAYTIDNAVSSRGLIILEDKTNMITTRPNLYAVMVGVSDYKGTDLDLKYPADDANDISAAVSIAARKYFNGDSTEHVFMYNLTTAKDHYQLPEKNSIKKLLEEIGRRSNANDILLIFFAGHGVMSGSADKKQFYFLTADASTATATDAIKDVGISTTELVEWIKPQRIKAQKRILIFDACNSGQAINDIAGQAMKVRNDDKTQQLKAIDKLNEKSGLFILSASASNQAAYESGSYSHGLLTYSLLKAIKEQPDILEDGKYLNLSRWFNAAEKRVTELSKENNARQDPQIITNTNFDIGLVDQDVIAMIVLGPDKPVFGRSNFQNSDEAIARDDLQLGNLIDLQLYGFAESRGESKINFEKDTKSEKAFSLSGRYRVNGDNIKVIVNIEQKNMVQSKFELSGTIDKLNELAASIVERAAGKVK
jgi:WD40 repeat protein/uncharacterized caspase-like protein